MRQKGDSKSEHRKANIKKVTEKGVQKSMEKGHRKGSFKT